MTTSTFATRDLAAASTDPRVRAYVTGPHSTGRSGITISNDTKEQ